MIGLSVKIRVVRVLRELSVVGLSRSDGVEVDGWDSVASAVKPDIYPQSFEVFHLDPIPRPIMQDAAGIRVASLSP
jgi:hypothetical protein